MKAPAGAVVSLYMDTRNVMEIGDEVHTRGGRRYELVEVRQQTRGKHTGRWHLKARVLADDHPVDPDVTVHVLWWYRR